MPQSSHDVQIASGNKSLSSSYETSTSQSMGTSAGSLKKTRSAASTSASRKSTRGKAQPEGDNLIEQWSPNGYLDNRRVYILSQGWFQGNLPEPTLEDGKMDDPILAVKEGESSLFDPFFDQGGSHRCRWLSEDCKQRCERVFTRKEHAQDHVREHFDYAPFRCDGVKCGTPGWYVGCQLGIALDTDLKSSDSRFRCISRLKEHIKRTVNPTTVCEIWYAFYSARSAFL